MSKKNQSERLVRQQKKTHGVIGIFGSEAQVHDATVALVAVLAQKRLQEKYPNLLFRHRTFISKQEINKVLQKTDRELGTTLFVADSKIKPDGGIVEVKDDAGNWRVILVSEAKHQGKDIENIRAGKLVGKSNDQDLMIARNAIERAHKNIAEIANFMLSESHFPYVLFLGGSNFLTQNVPVKRPDGRIVTLTYNSGTLNRLDRLTAANYGMPINRNLCKNKFVMHEDASIMLQAASIYTQGAGDHWSEEEMLTVMLDIAETSLKILGRDLFEQLTKKGYSA